MRRPSSQVKVYKPLAETGRMKRGKFTPEVSEKTSTLKWSPKPQKLKEILLDCSLPQVVRVAGEEKITGEVFDWSQPLLLYCEQSAVKMYATRVDEGTKKATTVVIPAEHQGWLEAVGDSEKESWDTIAKVVAVMPNRVLSLTAIKGFVLQSADTQDQMYAKQELPYGEFVVDSVLEDSIRYRNRKQAVKCKLMRCLKCQDLQQRSVLIPLKTKGMFYATCFRKNSRLKNSRGQGYPTASTIKKFAAERKIPFSVRLLRGPTFSEDLCFGGTMKIGKIERESTLLGCSLNGDPSTMFELALPCDLAFYRALDKIPACRDPRVRKTLKFAAEAADGYAKSLKVRRGYNRILSSDCDECPGSGE